MADASWEIAKVADRTRDWSSKQGGKMRSYYIGIKTDSPQPPDDKDKYDGVELAQRETTPAPTVGQKLDGYLETRTHEGRRYLKFKKAQRGAGGGGRAWKPRPDDSPLVFAQRQASIARQHSQDMAIRVLELAKGDEAEARKLLDILGIEHQAEDKPIGLIAAVQMDVDRYGRAAWDREAENGRIKTAMAEAA